MTTEEILNELRADCEEEILEQLTKTQKYIQEIIQRDRPENNFEWLVKVANDLRFSKGFYTRLWDNLNSMDDEELEETIENLNQQPKFNDALDCILWLEE